VFTPPWIRVDLRRVPPDLLLALAAAVALLAFVQTFRLFYRGWSVRRRLTLARERGAAGEIRAEILLRRLGFTILGRQVPVRYGLGVDGAEVAVELRADYVVAARGRRYVAEVKTGTYAPRLSTATTRRQLLEYRVAYDVDGVLLVDADAGTVQRVVFPLPGPARPAPGGRLAWLVVGMAAGALAMAAARAL
jgi:hypothetical protein